jgi:uncharacterized repeat protein (TIGR01451 family)
MRFFYILRIIAVLVAGLFVAGKKAEAQGFGLSVTSSADSILVSNSLTYTITVTNLTGFLLQDVQVSNALPASAQFVNAVPGQGFYETNGSSVVFDLLAVGQAQIVQMNLTIQPTVAGVFTNTVSVTTTNIIINPTVTNVLTEVTNPVPLSADLSVTLTGPVQTVVANDWMTYGVTAKNLGPDTASGIFLTNTLPPGVGLKSVSPNVAFSVMGSNRIFNLGTMNSGAITNLQFTVQPTNAGVLNFSASIGSSSTLDPNLTNNFAGTNISIINYLAGQLTTSLVSTQKYNPQNGLVEQTIAVSNVGTSSVPAVRVVVTGLTAQLFNSVGINNGSPFVVLNTALPAGQSVNLLLQFFAANYFPLADSQLQPFAVPVPYLTPPAAASTSTLLKISRLVRLADGNLLLEFPSVLGRKYTVVYADNVSFSNAMIAPPAITAPANRVQWIDYGPPATTSATTNSAARFYRVFQNP